MHAFVQEIMHAFVQEIQTLFSTHPPPFVYIYDPVSVRTASTVLETSLSGLLHVHLDAVSCFSQKLLFDNILNSLPGLDPDERYNDSWDSFLHGLGHHQQRQRRAAGHKDVPLVISVEQVDRLKPDTIVPLSRLRELVLFPPFFNLFCDELYQSQTNVTVVFISQTQWQDVKPASGASPEPYYIDVKPLTKSGILPFLCRRSRRSR